MKKLFLSIVFISSSSAFANWGASYDLTYPILRAITKSNESFKSDLRIEYGINNNWSLGGQFYFDNSNSVAGSSTTSSGGASLPSIQNTIDREILVFAKWYSLGNKVSSAYFGSGAGFAQRKIDLNLNGSESVINSAAIIFSAQVGWQWMFSEGTGLSFELQMLLPQFKKSISQTASNYSYVFNFDSTQLNPKIMLSHSF